MVIDTITEIFNCAPNDISDIAALKKGMTNDSFTFIYKDIKYIIRIPGAGTDLLINRNEEHIVYQTIESLNICDKPIYINPQNGCKITLYIKNSTVCNPFDFKQVQRCMETLKSFHDHKLSAPHYFDIFERIRFYESLWIKPSKHDDYNETFNNIMKLEKHLSDFEISYSLTHIDAVPDNFLFVKSDEIQLIDWEYAANQDPHLDIAMFAVYAMYERNHVEKLIDLYFQESCSKETRNKIYLYIAVCGLLWSNWCEYKEQLGIEFGEYALRQYRFAVDYYKIFKEEYA